MCLYPFFSLSKHKAKELRLPPGQCEVTPVCHGGFPARCSRVQGRVRAVLSQRKIKELLRCHSQPRQGRLHFLQFNSVIALHPSDPDSTVDCSAKTGPERQRQQCPSSVTDEASRQPRHRSSGHGRRLALLRRCFRGVGTAGAVPGGGGAGPGDGGGRGWAGAVGVRVPLHPADRHVVVPEAARDQVSLRAGVRANGALPRRHQEGHPAARRRRRHARRLVRPRQLPQRDTRRPPGPARPALPAAGLATVFNVHHSNQRRRAPGSLLCIAPYKNVWRKQPHFYSIKNGFL
jgi:hypothetical protein